MRNQHFVRRGSLTAVAAALFISAAVACAPHSAPRTATTPPPRGVAPPPSAFSEVDAVAYRALPDGTAEGTTARVGIQVRPNASGETRVAVFEQYSGGTGDQWRASTWIGAVHASKVLGRRLQEYEISVSVGGFIDGPSAGALVTAGMIATMQGVPVRPDATMTGTVNPDGTVGPVSGIRYKMEAAARSGKRAFGYPVGCRFEPTGEGDAVDLRAHGARLGLEVYEIADIEHAYTLLTGGSLPRVAAVPPSLMVPSPVVEQQMRERIGAWGAAVREGLAEYEQQPEPLQVLLRSQVGKAVEYWQQSERYLRQGLVSMAYKRARDAAVFASNIPQDARMLVHVLTLDVEALLAEAEQVGRVEQEVRQYFAALRMSDPQTVGDALTLVSAYDYGLQAHSAAAKAQADRGMALAVLRAVIEEGIEDPARVEELVGQAGVALASAASWSNASRLLMIIGLDGVQLGLGRTSIVPLDRARLVDLAHSTTIAAKAVYDYVDALIVQSYAEQAGVSNGVARQRLVGQVADYRSATIMTNVARDLREPQDVHQALMALAAAERAFVDCSLLIMRHYSLGVRQDESGQAVSVSNDLALIHALEAADVRARESAAIAATRIGRIPDDASVRYQRSRMLREGTLDDRLNSLRGMWSAAVTSRSAGHLAALP